MASEQPLEPVYLLTGGDRPKIETAVHRLRRRFPAEAVEHVSALDTSGEAVARLCNAGSLCGGWNSRDIDAVAAYLRSPAPATVLALVGHEVKKTTALWKLSDKAGDV